MQELDAAVLFSGYNVDTWGPWWGCVVDNLQWVEVGLFCIQIRALKKPELFVYDVSKKKIKQEWSIFCKSIKS